MAWEHLHREEAEQVGEPADATFEELTGEAPPSAYDDDGTPIDDDDDEGADE